MNPGHTPFSFSGSRPFQDHGLLQLLCNPNCLHLLWAVSRAPFSCLLPQPQYFHTRNTPPAHTLLEFLSYTASASQEICSALFSRFLSVFKRSLIPVCLKNAEHSLLCSFSAFPSFCKPASTCWTIKTTPETQYTWNYQKLLQCCEEISWLHGRAISLLMQH